MAVIIISLDLASDLLNNRNLGYFLLGGSDTLAIPAIFEQPYQNYTKVCPFTWLIVMLNYCEFTHLFLSSSVLLESSLTCFYFSLYQFYFCR